MAANKGKLPAMVNRRSPVLSSRVQSMSPPPNGSSKKKKKNKKGKGKEKSIDTSSANAVYNTSIAHLDMYDREDEDDEDDDSIPPLEPLPYSHTGALHTGLSPTLESVHISTTASLTANANNPAAQSELLATANDLYRNMGMMHGPVGEGGVKMTTTTATIGLRAGINMGAAGGGGAMISADDEEYWAAFPPHIKNFVRSVWAQAPFESPGDEKAKAQAMYAIAQQMVQSGKTTHTTTTTTTSKGDGVYPPSLPFDPSMFSDPAFTLSLEQAAAAFHNAPPPSLGRTTTTTTNVVIEQEGYCSDDGDDDDDGGGGGGGGGAEQLNGRPRLTQAEVILSYQEALQQKLNKNIKNNMAGQGAAVPRPVVADPVPKRGPNLTPSVDRKGIAPDSWTTIHKQMPAAGQKSQSPAAAAAAAPQPPPPPPSSRAAGKQPMAYLPNSQQQQQQQQTQSTTQRTTSARAASKAPLPPHAYPHNHPPHHHPSPPSSNASGPHKPRPPAANPTPAPPKPNKIWSTSTIEERERIKEFWLGLGEEERRNLVKIEKDTVLRKMKEQQKHSCSCAVCGRKRNAIEDELEVLYDAYYEELEQYANYQQRYVSSGGTLPPPPGPGPFPGSVELDKDGVVIGQHHKPSHHPPPRPKNPAVMTNGRKPPKTESEFDDDEGEEEEYEEEEYEEEEEDEEEDEDEEDDGEPEDEEDVKAPRGRKLPSTVPPPTAAAAAAATRGRRPPPNGTAKPIERDGLFNLGNSLTVTG
ncbi:hypothetical protein PILCRDRAFT_16832, partial [Piloderma croceum F 1598]